MIQSRAYLLAIALALAASSLAHGAVETTVEHIDNAHATREFKLAKVPPASKTDAAAKAKISLVSGQPDPNSGDLEKLTDGKLPVQEDEPDQSFFFNEGSAGGRLVLDLGRVIAIRQVNVYSWHPNTRGPQVYTLYGADGAAAEFDPAPKEPADPQTAGWTLVASVDTRPRKPDGAVNDDDEAMGGQYAVSISDRTGAPVGNYRYLLFVVSRTEDRDDWGNTFLSEIDVVDAKAAATAPASTREAASHDAGIIRGEFVTIDVTGAPDLESWARTTLLPICDRWYPRIVEMLATDGFTAPKRATVCFRDGMGTTPASTSGTGISCNAAWFRRNLRRDAAGAVVHELVHVVQSYRGRGNNPPWLVEGIADYIRWFKFEPQSRGAEVRDVAKARYDDGYRVTANFLDWVTRTRDPQIVTELNASMRNGTYNDELWADRAGKSLRELGEQWKLSLVNSNTAAER